jgi:hypothetical protein
MFTPAPRFGKFHSALKTSLQRVRAWPLHHLESLLAHRLPPALLAPNPDHANSRQRDYPPKLTFLAFLDQILNPDASCRSAVRQIQADYHLQSDARQLGAGTSSYCEARARWTLAELTEIRRHLAEHTAHTPLNLGWGDLPPVKLVDGTCPTRPPTAGPIPNPPTKSPNAAFPWCVWSGSSPWKRARCSNGSTALTPPAKRRFTSVCD